MFRVYEFIDAHSGDSSVDFNTFEAAYEYYLSRIESDPNNPITLVEILDEHKGNFAEIY